MACEDEIHENDVGTEFVVTIVKCVGETTEAADISTATLKEMFFLKSDGTKLSFTAIFTSIASGGAGDGSDGKISYFSALGDLTPIGGYKIQGKVTTPAGEWFSTIDKFKVYKNL